MKRLFLFSALFLFLTQTLNSQWTSNYGGLSQGDSPIEFAKGLSVTTDVYGNCYVAGFCYEIPNNNDILVIKYNEYGDTAWVRTYDGGCGSDDKAYGIVVDADGFIYVVGSVSVSGMSYDVIVLKYDNNGVLQYGTPFHEADGIKDDKGLDIAVSQSGYIYITGYTTGENGYTNILIQKYSETGLIWSNLLDGAENLDSKGYGIVVDELDNVYITGYTGSSENSNNIITAKYNTDGVLQWQNPYSYPSGGDDQACDIAIDEDYNVYVAGYVTTTTGLSDCVLLKYDNDGSFAFSKNSGNWYGEDKAYAIVVDNFDNSIIITGFETSFFSNKDYVTIKYNKQGNVIWKRNYNGPVYGNDKANAIGLLDDGRIVVTGESKGTFGDYDFATIKYSKYGSVLHISRYSMTGNSEDIAKDIAVDNTGAVYITGSSELIVDNYNVPSFATTLTLEWGAPDMDEQIPVNFELSQNYPNPFNPSTNINFTILKNINVKINVYDLLGRLVQTLINEELTAGTYKITFNGNNLSSGTYFYEMTAGDFRDVKKMILIK